MSFSDYFTTTALNTTLGDDIYIGPNMARDDVRPALQQLAADGKQLADQIVGTLTVTSATGQSVGTKGLLAAISAPVNGQLAHLAHATQGGMFRFDTSNLSAYVTLDTNQGIYVAPSTASSGASGAWVRIIQGDIELSWFGVAEGVSDNAARVEAAFAQFGARGAKFRLPQGLINFEREVNVTKPVVIVGHGKCSYSTVSNGGTLVQFPAGKNGFVFKANGSVGAQGASAYDFTVYQPAGLSTSATASYTAGSTTITITGGTNDYAVGQVLRLRGAGAAFTPTGKTAAINNGSNVATITSAGGNPGVYVGQKISIAGAGVAGAALVGYVGAWNSTTVTIVDAAGSALNASTTVAGAAYTISYPLVAKIASIVGSTITITQTPNNSLTVTGEKLEHCDTGIYSEVTLFTTNVNSVGFDLGLFLHGETANGCIADNGAMAGSNFSGRWCGGLAVGADANLNQLYTCNLAGSLVGFLDMSLLGNQLFGCHFAFNVGYASVFAAQYSALFGCYFENGTSYMGAGTCYAYGCTGLRNGSGIKYFGHTDDIAATGNSPSLKILETRGSITAREAYLGSRSRFDNTGRLRIESDLNGTLGDGATGLGLELGQDGTRSQVISYNRTSSAYIPLRLAGSTVDLAPSGTVTVTIDGNAVDLASGKVVKVNGTQVVTARQTGTAANATDLATAITLVNDLKAKLVAHGLIS